MQEKILLQLLQNRIFSGLTQTQLLEILDCITHASRKYEAGELVVPRGKQLEHLGIVLSGELSFSETGGSGLPAEFGALGPNQLFGEAVAFSSDCVLPYDIIAKTGTCVLYLTRNFFLMPCGKNCPNANTHHIVLRNMLRLLSDRTISLGRKVKYLSAPDLKTKIAMYLCDLCDATESLSFQLPLNRDRLSEFLSVARPSLSREMIRLKELGLIDFQRSYVTILDIDALRFLSTKAPPED